MADLILLVWAKGEAAAGHDPIELYELADIDLSPDLPHDHKPAPHSRIAHYTEGIDPSLISLSNFLDQESGDPFVLDQVLSQAGLSLPALLEHIGKELCSQLLPGDVLTTLIARIDAGCRVYLDLGSEKLLELPWELLLNGNDTLMAIGNSPWCFGRPWAKKAAGRKGPVKAELPYRIMVVIGSEKDDTKIKSAEELSRIERQAHLKNSAVLLRVLENPSSAGLEKELAHFQPHIFHFIGHCDASGPEPVINFWDAEHDQNDPWTFRRVYDVFSIYTPRLAFLNACETAATSKSLARAFLDAGCSAVLAMMGEIRGDSSVEFSERFYRELFGGKSVAEATAIARHYLKTSAHPQARSNWPLPRLWTNGDLNKCIKSPTTELPLRKLDKPCDDFVDRWDHRWETVKQSQTAYSRLLVLYGKEKLGKSEMLRMLAAVAAHNGEHVAIVDVNVKTPTWQELLADIHSTVKKVAEGHESELRSIVDKVDSSERVVVAEYLKKLDEVAKQNVLIILDGMDKMRQDLYEPAILPFFCVPFVRPESFKRLRMMISLSEKPKGDFDWGIVPDKWEEIEIGNIEKGSSEWYRALDQFAKHWINKIDAANHNYFLEEVDGVRKHPKPSVKVLKLLHDLAETLE